MLADEPMAMTYLGTYWYANMVSNMLDSGLDYSRTLSEFFDDDGWQGFVRPFPKSSILHAFIGFAVDHVRSQETPDELDPMFLRWRSSPALKGLIGRVAFATPIEAELSRQHVPHKSFADWAASVGLKLESADSDDIGEYYSYLRDFAHEDVSQSDGERSAELDELDQLQEQQELLDEQEWRSSPLVALTKRLTDEVFFLLFTNRKLLLSMQERVAATIGDVDQEELARAREYHPEAVGRFRAPGKLKRCHIPTWAKRAIFYRDRGRCVFCNTDLSGTVTLQNRENFDHIIPLARGGANDVTNLQLLCRPCNARKLAGPGSTRNTVEKWY